MRGGDWQTEGSWGQSNDPALLRGQPDYVSPGAGLRVEGHESDQVLSGTNATPHHAAGGGPEGRPLHHRHALDVDGERHGGGQSAADGHPPAHHQLRRARGDTGQSFGLVLPAAFY